MVPVVQKYVKDGVIKNPALYQITIPDYAMDHLSPHGLQTYDDCVKKHQEKEYKMHLPHWSMEITNSGPIPRVNPDDIYSCNSFYNKCIYFWKDKKLICTSPIIMFARDMSWCLTMSGSLYSLNSNGVYDSIVYQKKCPV